MAVLAVFLTYHLNWIQQRRELIASGKLTDMDRSNATTAALPYMLSLLGEKGYHFLRLRGFETESELLRVQSLFPEAVVDGISARREAAIKLRKMQGNLRRKQGELVRQLMPNRISNSP